MYVEILDTRVTNTQKDKRIINQKQKDSIRNQYLDIVVNQDTQIKCATSDNESKCNHNIEPIERAKES